MLFSLRGISAIVGDFVLRVTVGPVFGSGVMAVDLVVSIVSLGFWGVPAASAKDGFFCTVGAATFPLLVVI